MQFNKKILKSVSCAFTLLVSSQFAAASAPNVLTTIKPLQLISQAITEGVTDSEVLLPPGASPHNHSLRPSDARKLHSADVIFWVGPSMESFLTRTLPSSEKVKVVAMMDVKSIKLRKNNEDDGHTHEHHDHHGHKHDHGEYDPHLWLSTDNGRAMAAAMAEALVEIDSKHASQYQENLNSFLRSLDETDERNKKKLAGLEERPFFVFHDAYGYLQDQYNLNIGGHVTLGPEQQSGLKHFTNLNHTMKSAGKTCIFREPQFHPGQIDSLINGLPVKVGVLDPLGEDIAVDPDGFANFINSLVDNITECMS